MKIGAGLTGLAMALLVAGAADAKEVAGNNYPETLNIAGNDMKLVGVGVRKKAFLFKVYTLGVYSKSGERTRKALMLNKEPKFLWLKMKRDITGKQMAEAMDESFRNNTKGDKFAAISERFEKMKALLPEKLPEGLDIGLYYSPGKGTIISRGTEQLGVIPGYDFSIALFKVWFGKKPVDSSLMNQILED